MNIQRLRNLTTGKLHTDMQHIYEDLEMITGQPGIMTHMIPRVMKAVRPWLREQVAEESFWEDVYDPTHVGEYDLPAMTEEESAAAMERFSKMPLPF